MILRPEPGWSASATAAHTLGLEVAGAPLFEIVPVAWDAPGEVDALLLGSANAARCAGRALAAYAGKPVYAVGEATAAATRAAGLVVLVTGDGDLAELVAAIEPAHRRILRLCGRDRTALAPLHGHEVIERTVYEAKARPLGELPRSAVIALHSPRATAHFAAECARLTLPRARFALAALSPAVAAAAGRGWAQVRSAAQPSDAALLALAREMCKTFVPAVGGP